MKGIKSFAFVVEVNLDNVNKKECYVVRTPNGACIGFFDSQEDLFDCIDNVIVDNKAVESTKKP